MDIQVSYSHDYIKVNDAALEKHGPGEEYTLFIASVIPVRLTVVTPENALIGLKEGDKEQE